MTQLNLEGRAQLLRATRSTDGQVAIKLRKLLEFLPHANFYLWENSTAT